MIDDAVRGTTLSRSTSQGVGLAAPQLRWDTPFAYAASSRELPQSVVHRISEFTFNCGQKKIFFLIRFPPPPPTLLFVLF
jgi:hypothetical protein